jgi:RsiW-degrading membrane proteinase PrsW (M82 family)
MYYTQCLLPVILPVLFWAAYHYYHDRFLPEPALKLLLAMALGVGAFYLGLSMYWALGLANLRYDAFALAAGNLPGLLAYAILVIGPLEELAKLIPFLLVILRLPDFDEPIDGIIYASFIALGFGAMENLYLLRGLDGFEAWGRAFAGPALHVVFASIWGYYIGRRYLCRRPIWPVVLASFAVSALVHGIYDFVVIGLAPEALPFTALLIAGIWVWRLKQIRYLHTLPPGPCPEVRL